MNNRNHLSGEHALTAPNTNCKEKAMKRLATKTVQTVSGQVVTVDKFNVKASHQR